MATWTSFYIKTTDFDKVVEKLKLLTGIPNVIKGEFPEDHYGSFLMDESLPDYLVVGLIQPDWIAVNYNSSNKLIDWCTFLSKEFDTHVIIILAQSVSDYYYFAYYAGGQKKRELEYCYSGDFDEINFGEKFDFENEYPGTKTDYNGEVEYMFDFDSIEEYSKHFGLTIQ